MIKQKTLLILGAGASVNFGFPLGLALLKKIYDFLEENTKEFYALLEAQFKEAEIQAFREALSYESSSIDSFLEYNEKFVDIGKVSIALALLPCEITESLFQNAIDRERNWYQLLFDRLSRDCPFNELQNNELRVITFNYDRSLEQFLYKKIKSRYNSESDVDCLEKVKSIPIIHVYGRLGCMPWQEPDKGGEKKIEYDSYKSYGSTLTYPATTNRISHSESMKIGRYCRKAVESSRSIKIMHHGEQEFEDNVYDLLKDNGVIHFLGFGYHPENMKRLKLRDYYQREAAICGTGMGLSQQRLTDIASLGIRNLHRRKTYQPPLSLEDIDIYTYLNNYIVFA